MSDPLSEPSRNLIAQLYAEHAENVYNWLHIEFWFAPADALEDAVMQAIVELCSRPLAPDVCPESAWRRLAREILRTNFRSEKRREEREKKYVALRSTSGPTPIESLVKEDEAAKLYASIVKTEEERAVFDLWLLNLCNPQEIAERLGHDPARTKTVLRCLLKRLERERSHHQSPQCGGAENP